MYRDEQCTFEDKDFFGLTVVLATDCSQAMCWDQFHDEWQPVDHHEGGVTIQNPDACRNGSKWYVNNTTTLSEMASYYAKQGGPNPSGAAYRSLQNQLEADIERAEYPLDVVFWWGDHRLNEEGYCMGWYDHSHRDAGSMEGCAKEHWDDFAYPEELKEPLDEAFETLAQLVLDGEVDNLPPALHRELIRGGHLKYTREHPCPRDTDLIMAATRDLCS